MSTRRRARGGRGLLGRAARPQPRASGSGAGRHVGAAGPGRERGRRRGPLLWTTFPREAVPLAPWEGANGTVLLSGKFPALTLSILWARVPRTAPASNPGAPWASSAGGDGLRWVRLCAGVARSPSKVQSCRLLAAGWLCPGPQADVMGAFGPRPLCSELPAWVVGSREVCGWGDGGVQLGAQLSALDPPTHRVSAGRLAGSWQYVCQD